MGDLIAQLIELVAEIWHADSQVRDRSMLGESGLERKSLRSVALLCGGTIVLLLLGGLLWWWFTRNK
jgi:hypothetical protein